MNPVVESFERAAETYVDSCGVQSRIAAHLARRITGSQQCPKQILELGCGTGELTCLLIGQFPDARVVATDASPGMINVAQQRITDSNVEFRTLVVDEKLVNEPEFKRDGFDLLASSMALHWVADLENVLRPILEIANQVAFSIPAGGTFSKWIAAHEELGLAHGVREFFTEEMIYGWGESLFSGHQFSVEFVDFQESFVDPLDFVRQLKRVGAACPREGHAPVNNLRAVLKQFPDGIEVNYRMAFVEIVRRSPE